jgi:hypothetical protein
MKGIGVTLLMAHMQGAALPLTIGGNMQLGTVQACGRCIALLANCSPVAQPPAHPSPP